MHPGKVGHVENSVFSPTVILYFPDQRSDLGRPAGLPLFVRTVKTAQRAGLTRFVLLFGPSIPERMWPFLQEGLPPGSVRWVARLTQQETSRLAAEPALLLPAHAVVDLQFIRNLLAVPPPETGQGIKGKVEVSSPWPLVVAGPGLLTFLLNGSAAGLALNEEIQTLVRQGKVVRRPAPEGLTPGRERVPADPSHRSVP